jgi:hypothetical protein
LTEQDTQLERFCRDVAGVTPEPWQLERIRRVGDVVTVTIAPDLTRFREAIARVQRSLHPLALMALHGEALREHQIRCSLCPDPPGRPRPLPVDGHEYRRRRNARRRRR